jgi:dTDP-4-dehydrorhamnose 3,5-epimerase
VVDIRKGSATYGEHLKIELSADNKKMLWVPPGFAHGFLTLQDDTIFVYKVTGLYNKESEGGLLWNDPQLGIDWGVADPLLSDKDKVQSSWVDFVTPFE